MDKILDKLGVYDLVAVLLSGISISTFTMLIVDRVYRLSIKFDAEINEYVIFFVISYFIGLVFQEMGSLIQKKILYKDNGLLKKALQTSEKSSTYMTVEEKNRIYKSVTKKIGSNNDNDVYNYCKFYVFNRCDTSRIDKDQSISAMSRSLSLYFVILTIILFFTNYIQFDLTKFIIMIINFSLSFILYNRSVRFTIIRYISIFRTYYYYNLQNNIK